MWGGTYTFASVPPGLTAQQLTIEIAAAKGGGVAVRADGQAGWLPPRPVADQIPAGIRRIRVAYITRTDLGNGGLPGTSSTETRVEPFDITSAAHIRRVVAALNVLPHATRSALACHSRFGTEISLMFYGVARKTPLANARVFPNCSILVLAINGRPTQELSIAGAVVGPPLLFTLKPPQRSTSTTSTSSATSSSRAAGTTTR
jgi:hypothetical protein